jgi:hypothetical protein
MGLFSFLAFANPSSPPRVPVDRVMSVLQKVGRLFVYKMVGVLRLVSGRAFGVRPKEESNSTHTKITTAKNRRAFAPRERQLAFMGPMRSESMMDSPFNGEERATVALKTGTILVLHRGTLHRTVGTKDAAVARLWAQHSCEQWTDTPRPKFQPAARCGQREMSSNRLDRRSRPLQHRLQSREHVSLPFPADCSKEKALRCRSQGPQETRSAI